MAQTMSPGLALDAAMKAHIDACWTHQHAQTPTEAAAAKITADAAHAVYLDALQVYMAWYEAA